MSAIVLTESIAKAIRAHGVKTYPHECCGALLGLDGEAVREVRELYPLINRRDDSPRNRFSVSAADFRAAESAADELGLTLLGWYHSHPDHPARPSDYDREQAWPWYSYIIVSVAASGPGEMTSWRLTDDRATFNAEEIRAQQAAAGRR